MGQHLTVLLLCGGLGRRLRPAAGDIPKILAPVAGRPFLEYQMRLLRLSGATRIVLCTGVGAAKVEEAARRAGWPPQDLMFSREDRPLGTGGAARLALDCVEDEVVAVANGDTWIETDLQAMAAAHQARNASATMALVQLPDRGRYGAVTLLADDSIAAFSEKSSGEPGWINGGLYLLHRRALELLQPGAAASIETDMLPRLSGRGLYGYRTGGSFIDIGTPESWEAAQSLLPARLAYLEQSAA